MDKFMITDSVIPVRKDPEEQSEMLTQLLFGDEFVCLVKDRSWVKIKTDFDNYEGYIDAKFVNELSEERDKKTYIVKSLISEFTNTKTNLKLVLPAGCYLRGYNTRLKELTINNNVYRLVNGDVLPIKEGSRENIVELAKSFINSPYLWGGKTVFGIDCSGLTQIAYKIAGYKLLRDASQQATQGKKINSLDKAQMADLLFFGKNGKNKITHVGIYLGENKIIHASGRVKINNVDDKGIFDENNKIYTHDLLVIKTIL